MSAFISLDYTSLFELTNWNIIIQLRGEFRRVSVYSFCIREDLVWCRTSSVRCALWWQKSSADKPKQTTEVGEGYIKTLRETADDHQKLCEGYEADAVATQVKLLLMLRPHGGTDILSAALQGFFQEIQLNYLQIHLLPVMWLRLLILNNCMKKNAF